MIEVSAREKWYSGVNEGDEGDVPPILTILNHHLLTKYFGVFKMVEEVALQLSCLAVAETVSR